MNFLMLDFFNTVINTLFRDIPDYVRYILIIVFLGLSFFFLAKTMNLKKSAEKTPVNYGFLVLFIIFFMLCMLYIWLR